VTNFIALVVASDFAALDLMKIVLKWDRQTGPQVVAALEQLLTARHQDS
jgi:hypothetical protein